MGRIIGNDWRRLCSKVSIDEDGHWIWNGPLDKNGYGHFKLQGHDMTAHHAYLILTIGYAPSGDWHAAHLCNRTDCVYHVEWQTRSENMKGRSWSLGRTHCPQGHPYEEGNIYWRENGKPRCRTCTLKAVKEHNASSKR